MMSSDDTRPDEAAPDAAAGGGGGDEAGEGVRAADAPSLDGDMLSDLLSIRTETLESFRTQHLPASAASDEDLQRAQHLLQALVSAMREGSGERWRRVEAACDALEGTHRPGTTVRPPPGALDVDDELEESDDGSDRPTTPPALPQMMRARAMGTESSWSDSSPGQLRAPPLPNLSSAQPLQAGTPSPSQHDRADPAADGWTQAQGPGGAYAAEPTQQIAPAQAAQALESAAAPQGWGQAYAPGSLPASLAQPALPVHPQQPGATQAQPQPQHPQVPQAIHGAPNGQAPAHPYAQAPLPGAPQPGVAPHPDAAPLPASYEQAPMSSSDERAPTPPLFSPERTDHLPPASARTPVAALPKEEEQVPSSARTAPHAVAPTPSPPPAVATAPASGDRGAPSPSREAGGGTAELTFASQAHALALSLEEYAALCAERDLTPAAEQLDIEHRYEIYDPRARAAVDRAFELRLEREPALRDRFQQLYRDATARLSG